MHVCTDARGKRKFFAIACADSTVKKTFLEVESADARIKNLLFVDECAHASTKNRFGGVESADARFLGGGLGDFL